jgi:hypothetical protein
MKGAQKFEIFFGFWIGKSDTTERVVFDQRFHAIQKKPRDDADIRHENFVISFHIHPLLLRPAFRLL